MLLATTVSEGEGSGERKRVEMGASNGVQWLGNQWIAHLAGCNRVIDPIVQVEFPSINGCMHALYLLLLQASWWLILSS